MLKLYKKVKLYTLKIKSVNILNTTYEFRHHNFTKTGQKSANLFQNMLKITCNSVDKL